MPRSFYRFFGSLIVIPPNDRMEYNGNTPDAFSHKKFLNVSRLITRETFRSRNEILCRVISVRCFNARKRKKKIPYSVSKYDPQFFITLINILFSIFFSNSTLLFALFDRSPINLRLVRRLIENKL